jgi:hypothetical protein
VTGLLCHSDADSGVTVSGRLALHYRYPNYNTEGFNALYARPPVIYTTSAIPAEVLESLSTKVCSFVTVVARKLTLLQLMKFIFSS